MKQQQFDFERAEQLALIERWQPPKVPGVSASAMKHVLRAIDSHGRGREAWPSLTTLAAETALGLRTVKRAIKALAALSLICVERKGPMTVNHYRIVWTELALLLPQATPMPNPAERSATTAERSAMVTERSAMVARHEVPWWPPKRQQKRKETTTTDSEPKKTSENVVVVSLEAEVSKCGVGRAAYAVARALAAGLSVEDIRGRVAAYRELPDDKRRPGTLYNWLAFPQTYDRAQVVGTAAALELARGLRPADECRRAELIRYGRRQGWPHETLQRAVKRFEAELAIATDV